ncbi:MAG: SpoIIE family protein phosphatase [Thermoanaerobaculia bacterium]
MRRALIAIGAVLGILAALGTQAGAAAVRVPAFLLLGGLLVGLLLYLGWKGLRAFLWRVGRRLAFSYFLIGILPIPMLALLLGLTTYVLCGFFMGTVYGAAADGLDRDLRADAALAAATGSIAPAEVSPGVSVATALYRDGRRTAGDERAPARWPDWIDGADEVSFVSLPDGSKTRVAASPPGPRRALAFVAGPARGVLAERSGLWLELLEPGEPESGETINLQLGESRLALRTENSSRENEEARRRFFDLPADPEEPTSWSRKPFLWWGQVAGPVRSLEDGEPVTETLIVSLNGSLRILRGRLFAGSSEVNTSVWASLIAVVGLLTSLYGIALLMALFMIIGLSLAVNRLSRATRSVQEGDFSVRIPVRRKDQLGELQESFNRMTAGLERAVATATQKELLDKELQIARDLQRSLLPADLPSLASVEFSTLFEPSAAIGGDYFDVLRIDRDRLAVVVADVSGHGLPTGLRMAMLKAALGILVEDGRPPADILSRLNRVVRSEENSRFFVTATIAVIDFARARMDLTNAGHPPTYLLRDGEVDEILLPGSPLGALGESYGRREVELRPGDVVVWLSDGLIEATDRRDEQFGYQRVREALAGPGADPAAVRDRLLAAVQAHTEGRPIADDRTLVAMAYEPGAAASSPRNE